MKRAASENLETTAFTFQIVQLADFIYRILQQAPGVSTESHKSESVKKNVQDNFPFLQIDKAEKYQR